MAEPSQPQAPAVAVAPAATVLDGLPTATLIDLYFDAEGAAERDALLTRLCARDGAEVDAFLSAMLAHDEDIFARLAAAGALLARGYGAAREVLRDALHAAGDDETFLEAMDALLQGLGADAFDDLLPVVDDDARAVTERLLAMSGLERSDPARASQVFVQQMAQMPQPRPLDLLVVEAMVGCFVREDPAGGAQALAALRERVSQPAYGLAADSATHLAPEEDASQLLATLDGGLAVLRASIDAEATAEAP